jgi:hypothetical protein
MHANRSSADLISCWNLETWLTALPLGDPFANWFVVVAWTSRTSQVQRLVLPKCEAPRAEERPSIDCWLAVRSLNRWYDRSYDTWMDMELCMNVERRPAQLRQRRTGGWRSRSRHRGSNHGELETTAAGSFLFRSNTSQLSFWAELQVVLQLDWARLMSVN